MAATASSAAQPASARIVALVPACCNSSPTTSGPVQPAQKEISVEAACTRPCRRSGVSATRNATTIEFVTGVISSIAAMMIPSTSASSVTSIRGMPSAIAQLSPISAIRGDSLRCRRGASIAPSRPPAAAIASITPTAAEDAPPLLATTTISRYRPVNSGLLPANSSEQ